jgi:hypothetical protein
MADSPERPIEKLLRECAEKRREEAGEPLNLHPANRRALQAEVSRLYGGHRSGPRLWAFFSIRAWSGWAYGLAAFALAALIIGLLLPGPHRVATTTQLAKKEELRESFAKAPTDALPLDDKASRLDLKAQTEPPGNAPRLASREAEAPRGLSLGRDQVPRPEDRTPPSAPRAESLDTSALAASAPSSSTTFFAAASANAPLSEQKRIVQAFANEAPKEARTAPGQASASVLASFRVEQNGPEIRVVDEDGSVYSGNLATPSQEAPVTLKAGRAQNEGSSKLKDVQGRRQLSANTPAMNQVQSGYNFRVSGTNLSLNQRVVFSGQLLLRNGIAQQGITNGVTVSSGGAQNSTAGPEALSLPDYGILGRAVVGSGTEIEVNAQPTNAPPVFRGHR